MSTADHFAVGPLVKDLVDAMCVELRRYGLDRQDILALQDCRLKELRHDPVDDSHALYMEWRDSYGHCRGSLLVYADGMAYAEWDVLQLHPQRPQCFVEAVTSWGRVGEVKADLNLCQSWA